jgi:hypothetical protein
MFDKYHEEPSKKICFDYVLLGWIPRGCRPDANAPGGFVREAKKGGTTADGPLRRHGSGVSRR